MDPAGRVRDTPRPGQAAQLLRDSEARLRPILVESRSAPTRLMLLLVMKSFSL